MMKIIITVMSLIVSCGIAAKPTPFFKYGHVCVGQHDYEMESGTGTTSDDGTLYQLRVWPRGFKNGSSIWNPGETQSTYQGTYQLHLDDTNGSYTGTPEYCLTDKVGDGSGPYHRWMTNGTPSEWNEYSVELCGSWTGL